MEEWRPTDRRAKENTSVHLTHGNHSSEFAKLPYSYLLWKVLLFGTINGNKAGKV